MGVIINLVKLIMELYLKVMVSGFSLIKEVVFKVNLTATVNSIAKVVAIIVCFNCCGWVVISLLRESKIINNKLNTYCIYG